MTEVRSCLSRAALLAVLSTMAVGCSWINRPINYQDAREAPPLQVPSDLITPRPNPALQLPAASAPAGNVQIAPPGLGANVAMSSSGLPRSASSLITIDDAPASAWRRVGTALDRSECCRIIARSEEQSSYTLELLQSGPPRGRMARWFGRKLEPSQVMTVSLTEVPSGTRIQVLDNAGSVLRDDAALTVLGVIEARLR